MNGTELQVSLIERCLLFRRSFFRVSLYSFDMYLYTRRPLKLPIVLLLKQSAGNICSLLDLSDLSCPLPRFQSWFDFDVSGEETREKIIAQEREQNVLSTLHQVHMYILRSST